MKSLISLSRRKVGFITILTLAALGCRAISSMIATPTPIPSPTPKPIPLSDIDLSNVVLRESELPDSSFVSGETLSSPAQFEGQVFSDYPEVHKGLMNAHYVSFHTDQWKKGYVNGIMVYDSIDQANSAYNRINADSAGDIVSVATIGDEISVKRSDTGLLSIMVLWRYKEAVCYLTIFHIDGTALPPTDDVIRIIEKIQNRLENGH